MKNIGRYIAGFVLAVPAAFLFLSTTDVLLDELVSHEHNTELTAYFGSWAAIGLLLSRLGVSKHIKRAIAAVLVAFPTAFFISAAFNYFITHMFFEGFDDYKLNYVVLNSCWTASSLWIARAATGQLSMSRGCGLFSLAALGLPFGLALTVMLAPQIETGYYPPLTDVLISALIGVPLGLFSAGLAHVLKRQDTQMRNEIESRKWRG